MSQAPPAAAGRGLLLIAASVVLGLILLSQGFDDGAATSGRASGGDEATVSTETTQTVPDETIPEALPPSQVPVIVSNAAGVSGLAGEVSGQLEALGYITSEPETAEALSDFTTIYYVQDFEAEAIAVANALGYPAEQVVQPSPNPAPAGDGVTEVVIVVLGADVSSLAAGGAAAGGGAADGSTPTTLGITSDTLLAPG